MASNLQGQNENYGEKDLTTEVDLNASAAVIATRGDNVTHTKTGTGTYSSVWKNTNGWMLVEVLGQGPSVRGASIAGNVQSVQITSITQSATTGDVTVLWTTKTSAPAAADTTTAITVCIWWACRVSQLKSPI